MSNSMAVTTRRSKANAQSNRKVKEISRPKVKSKARPKLVRPKATDKRQFEPIDSDNSESDIQQLCCSDDTELIKRVVDQIDADTYASAIQPFKSSRPVNEKRAILATIRRRFKEQNGVVYCSEMVRKDLTVSAFCFEYVREHTIKRFMKTKRNSKNTKVV